MFDTHNNIKEWNQQKVKEREKFLLFYHLFLPYKNI